MIKSNGGKLQDGCRLKCEAPVLELDFENMKEYFNGDRLPGIWITEPVEDDEGNVLGRTYTMAYPPSGDSDPDGEDALFFGGCYYDEAMGYTDPLDREKRVDCFRAAELLYRHSAGRGNAVACLCLGYVYSYDRCEGRYWVDPMTLETSEGSKLPYPREERAFECFAVAAEAGIAEACYKLGDMYKLGTGCKPDPGKAYDWYIRASKQAMCADEVPVVLGSIALRLAGCFEEGFGCQHSFSCALQMYRHAVAALGAAVDAGETWYEKPLAAARAGVKRCEQEVM